MDLIRHYILAPQWCLRGWKLLPYAAQRFDAPLTEFFLKDDWDLLLACDGHTTIDWRGLSDDQRSKYERWEGTGLIHRCPKGAQLTPEQEYRFYPARFKERVQWSITGKCNYRCRHCFMSAPEGVQGEPTWDELMVMLDAFERCGVRGISLTGGEPLIRADFWDLVDEILRRGMVVPYIFSNGALVTDEFLDKLEKRRMFGTMIQFSFDGVGWHDWMRGVPRAEQVAIDAIRRCRDRMVQTSVSMVLCKHNVGCIRETVNLLASLGVSSMKVGNGYPQGEWEHQKEHWLSQEEAWEAYLEYIPHYFEDGMPLSLGLEGFFSYDLPRQRVSAIFERNVEESLFPRAIMCSHVRREMYVSPQGRILPCMSMVGGPIEQQFPNMLETPLEEILDMDSPYMDIIDARVSGFMEHNPECKDCEWRTACCGGCRAVAVRDHPLDYLARDLVTCEYFKGGWKDRKDEVLRSIGRL